ncbi:DUF397 domain-containing protein [Nocardia sp. NPDC050630]|uniref:DUF397 domain-containing protein n=1 Tax=Nocardia sp. NPDC050630 TaxID=3364321 RepID=UPI00379A985B
MVQVLAQRGPGNDCVEVAWLETGHVGIRDSKTQPPRTNHHQAALAPIVGADAVAGSSPPPSETSRRGPRNLSPRNGTPSSLTQRLANPTRPHSLLDNRSPRIHARNPENPLHQYLLEHATTASRPRWKPKEPI